MKTELLRIPRGGAAGWHPRNQAARRTDLQSLGDLGGLRTVLRRGQAEFKPDLPAKIAVTGEVVRIHTGQTILTLTSIAMMCVDEAVTIGLPSEGRKSAPAAGTWPVPRDDGGVTERLQRARPGVAAGHRLRDETFLIKFVFSKCSAFATRL